MAKTVLAVEDSAAIRQVISVALSAAGLQVLVAPDGVEGLTLARIHAVDLVITDQNMPRMDGLSLIRHLRELPGYALTPILMLTTESSEEIKSKARAAGASGWMAKPFAPQRLVEAVFRLLG